jgi:transcription elongation factor GreA
MAQSEKGKAVPMTASGFEALQNELEQLKARRPSLVAEVANARSQGDLSENFAYHDARRQLGFLDGKIQTIENTLRRAQVVGQAGNDGLVRIGSKVVVRDEFGESSYEMVGPTEGNMARGLLSVASPLGAALIDHKPGETISFSSPGGQREATIVSVS